MGITSQKPSGFLRWAFRAPIALYRLGLGWLITSHFLMLTTTGRNSGKPRRAVIEVICHDRATNTYVIAAGWGAKSDWYRNILKTPQVCVDVGFRRFRAIAETLPVETAVSMIADYARRFPFPFRQLAKFMTGRLMTGTMEECVHLANSAPLVALKPLK